MKIPGKRIKGLSPDMAPDAAAAQVIGLRLDAVRLLAPLAAHQWSEDVEHVHQLRVATRRAASAMAAFEPCLKSKQARKTRKLLKSLRSSAGPARDADVHLAIFRHLHGESEGAERVAIEQAIVSIMQERERLQPPLTEAIEAVPDAVQARRFGKLVDTLKAPNGFPTLADLASHTLAPLASSLRQVAGAGEWNIEHLHECRIAAKKLRYACEIFECCLDETTVTRFKTNFVPLLDALGDLNDADNMILRIDQSRDDLAGAPADGLSALRSRFESDRDRRAKDAIEALRALLDSDFLDRLSGRAADRAQSA